MANIKICTKCGEIGLDQYDFEVQWASNRNKYYYRNICIECRVLLIREWQKNNPDKRKMYGRRYNRKNIEYNKDYRMDNKAYFINKRLLYKFNITLEDYEQMLRDQNYKCAICGKHMDDLSVSLCVDHDHNTGKIRGLLCKKCNSVLGFINDDINVMENMIKYLKNIKGKGEKCLKKL